MMLSELKNEIIKEMLLELAKLKSTIRCTKSVLAMEPGPETRKRIEQYIAILLEEKKQIENMLVDEYADVDIATVLLDLA